jgi:hypothetical protein
MLGSGHQNNIVQENSVFLCGLRGIHDTVADAFESAGQERSSATITTAPVGGMIASKALARASKLSQRGLDRLLSARAASKINCMSKTFGKYAQQAGPVTRAGATVEVLCHAHF